MKKILPIAMPNCIKTYHMTAIPMSILKGLKVDISDRILADYIDIINWKDTINYHYHKKLRKSYFKRRLFYSNDNDLVKNIKKNIDKMRYAVLTVNERYIPLRIANKYASDYEHDLLIYGYDDNQNSFYVFSYTDKNYNTRTLCTQKIKYNDIVTAYKFSKKFNNMFNNYSLEFNNHCQQNNLISNQKYFDLKLKEYATRQIRHDRMKLYIHLEKVTTKRANKIFIQNIYLLYEQKVTLEILASRYCQQKILYFENIKRETYKLLLMFLKAIIKNDEQLKNKAVDYLLDIEKKECKFLSDWLCQ